MSLNIEKVYDEKNAFWKIKLNGEIDIYTAGKLKDFLTNIIEEKIESIKINAEQLNYIDSTGLGVLIGVVKKLNRENKNLIIYNVKPSIKKLLNITELDKIFIIEG